MKKAIRSLFGLKPKGKKDKRDSEKTRTTSAANSSLNSAGDPHRRKSNSNRPSFVIVHEDQSEPHDLRPVREIVEGQRQQHSQAFLTREDPSREPFTSLQPKPRPQSEIAHNTTNISATSFQHQDDVQSVRRLYFHQPQKLDIGAGVGGPVPAAHPPSQGSSSTSNNQIKRSQSTRAPASAPQAVYGNGNPYQTYQCVARSSPPPRPDIPLLSIAQDRGYGTDPRQEAGPDDSSNKLAFSAALTRDSSDQFSADDNDREKQGLRRKTHGCDIDGLGSPHSIDTRADVDRRIEQKAYCGKVETNDDGEEDLASICIKPITFQHKHQQDQQDQQDYGHGDGYGHRQGQRSSKSPQHILPDLNRALPPLPEPEPGPGQSPAIFDDTQKRFSLNSLTSRSILTKQPDSVVEWLTTKSRTSSLKGKNVDRGTGGSNKPDTPSFIPPKIRQFHLDANQFMIDNPVPGLDTHPYRISLEYGLQEQARAHARRLAEEREFTQGQAALFQQPQDEIGTVVRNAVPMVPQDPMLTAPHSRPLSIESKGRSSPAVVSISVSPPIRAPTTTPEAKRLSNTSRGSARRIIYSADLAQGLPKGHIAREGNYEIVPTKRLSASSARTHNTSTKSRGCTTHVETTADDLDGVPGGPAPTAATLIIRPDHRGKSARVITTANRQDSDNTLRRSIISGNIKSANSGDNGERVYQQQYLPRVNHAQGLDGNIPEIVANKGRGDGLDVVPEGAMNEFPEGESDPASSTPRAGEATLLSPIDSDLEHRLRMAKRPTTSIPGHVISQHTHADPLDIRAYQLLSSCWIRPARMRSLGMVLERIDWLSPEENATTTTTTTTANHSQRTSYMTAATDLADLSELSPTIRPSALEGDEEDIVSDDDDGDEENEASPYSLDGSSMITDDTTTITATLDSAHNTEQTQQQQQEQQQHQPNRPLVLINGLTADELISSIRFESDREGSLGFYGAREFERDQEKRRREEKAKKEQVKTTAKVSKATITGGSSRQGGGGKGGGAGARGLMSTIWSRISIPLPLSLPLSSSRKSVKVQTTGTTNTTPLAETTE